MNNKKELMNRWHTIVAKIAKRGSISYQDAQDMESIRQRVEELQKERIIRNLEGR